MRKVNEKIAGKTITQNLHTTLYKIFQIRPLNGADDPFDTNAEFCLYDEPHNDYVYQDAWVNFLIHFIQTGVLDAAALREIERNGEKLGIEQYRI